jgi:hypothetical protein
MKSNLKQGFALPFAVALIVIFTILFGSILTTASFYKKQKLVAIKKIELNEISLIGLYDFYSAVYNAYIQNSPQEESFSDFFLKTQIVGFPGTNANDCFPIPEDSQVIISNDENSLIFRYVPSNQEIESCAISSQSPTSLVVKYSMTFSNSGSIKDFKALQP